MRARSLSTNSPPASSSIASCSGVASSPFLAFGLALLLRSAKQTSKCPSFAAKWSDVQPSSSRALTSADAYNNLRTHSAEPACEENMSAVMPMSGLSTVCSQPPRGSPRASGFCGFMTRGRRVSVHAPLSSARPRPLTLPSRACCSNSWFKSTASETRVPPRFAYAMEDLKPSSKAPQPAVASSPHEDMPDLFFLLPLLASELPQVPLHVSNTFML
mmetsp:Transcript_22395/g.63614  ORF Transcript_22395/g.63614 Transcript_22395/m.63614 type:complete len:216 (-) Transcript_22395:98-745(-)